MKPLTLLCTLLVFVIACDNKVSVDEDFVWREQGLSTDREGFSSIMQAMRDVGYAGEHKLVRFDGFIGVQGDIRGSWGLFGGSIKGSVASTVYVKYLWYVTEKRPFIHIFPFDRINLIIDDDCIEPTIRYQFNVNTIWSACNSQLKLYGKWSQWSGKNQQSYYETIEDMLIGRIISSQTVIKATIVISQEQLDTREYLLG